MRTTITFALLLLAGGLTASAQYTNRSNVLDGSGTRATGGGYALLSASGQPCGIGVSAGDGFVNQAGFLSTFFMQPGLDTDHDGLPDEADSDNDGDGLGDEREIDGDSFAPATPTLVNVADSDGDGSSDGAEATAGTDPSDGAAGLRITAISSVNGQRVVKWIARGNNERAYRVLTAADLRGPFTDVIYSNTVAGGTAPWYVVTNITTDSSAANVLFYRVHVTR